MTNKEFFDTLLISGKLSSKDFDTSKNNWHNICIQEILNHEKFIGKIYLNLDNLPEITKDEIILIIKALIIDFKLSDIEIEDLYKRLYYVKMCLQIDYRLQVYSLVKQLEENKIIKDRRLILNKCIFKRTELYNIQAADKRFKQYFRLRKNGKISEIYDMGNCNIICPDTKYIILGDKLEIVSKADYCKDIHKRDKYRLRFYW